MSAHNPVNEINEIVAKALKKHFDVIRLYMIRQNETDITKHDKLQNKVDRKVDNLLGYLLKNFPMPDKHNRMEMAACKVEVDRVVFPTECDPVKRALLYKELYNLPPTILLQVMPVAFMRDLLYIRRIRFNPENVTNWGEFVNVYASIICS